MAGTLVVEDEEAFRHLVQAVTYGDRFSLQATPDTASQHGRALRPANPREPSLRKQAPPEPALASSRRSRP